MQTIEMFCGTKSFSKVAKAAGLSTLTLDNKPEFEPDMCVDIQKISANAIPKNAAILWASPPCQAFSVAAIGRNWHRNGEPKHLRAVTAKQLVLKTLEIIDERTPVWWFIENPRGMLRKMPFMKRFRRETVTYCQYGDSRQKPTDIWTNADWWRPRPVCLPRSSCHEAAPRGSKTGTQGQRNSVERGRIPAALFQELIDQLLGERDAKLE